MAGARIELSNYLNNILLITDGELREAIINQGLDSFAAFRELTDGDMKDVCKRK